MLTVTIGVSPWTMRRLSTCNNWWASCTLKPLSVGWGVELMTLTGWYSAASQVIACLALVCFSTVFAAFPSAASAPTFISSFVWHFLLGLGGEPPVGLSDGSASSSHLQHPALTWVDHLPGGGSMAAWAAVHHVTGMYQVVLLLRFIADGNYMAEIFGNFTQVQNLLMTFSRCAIPTTFVSVTKQSHLMCHYFAVPIHNVPTHSNWVPPSPSTFTKETIPLMTHSKTLLLHLLQLSTHKQSLGLPAPSLTCWIFYFFI